MPVTIVPPGVLVNVQLSDEGKLFKTTLPVDSVHVGCVRVPTIGAEGVAGWAFISNTVADETQELSEILLTVTLYVPVDNPVNKVFV